MSIETTVTLDADHARRLYQQMLLIRRFEEWVERAA